MIFNSAYTSSGELIKCVGGRGGKEGEFNDPRGVTLYDNQVFVCDCDNHRIQVFDLDLNFVRSIGSRGKGRGEFKVNSMHHKMSNLTLLGTCT